MTVLWQKVDFMVHLGLRPWYSSQCADPPLCGVRRINLEPLQGCRTCKTANLTGLVSFADWLHWLEQGSPGEEVPAPVGTNALDRRLAPANPDSSVTVEPRNPAQDVELPPCPSGANHGCCLMPESCTSGQVRRFCSPKINQ